jgi:hypothetical protein
MNMTRFNVGQAIIFQGTPGKVVEVTPAADEKSVAHYKVALGYRGLTLSEIALLGQEPEMHVVAEQNLKEPVQGA